ncbi:hypothetical protein OV450_6948 [Actinobacteria bacterium OV450]|nr:hypothetical protein OV450_6948 [Actinobacteria bacterium OV450]
MNGKSLILVGKDLLHYEIEERICLHEVYSGV